MRELYSDDYESVAGDGATRLLPEGARRIAGALVFICLVGAMGVWAWRLGTRDAAEVPVIKAMAGPTRVEPEEPGGITAAHQGLEVNAVLAGQPPPRDHADGGAAVARGADRRGRAAGRAGARGAGDAGRTAGERGRRPADAACRGAAGLRRDREPRGAASGADAAERAARRQRRGGGGRSRAAADEPAAQPGRRPRQDRAGGGAGQADGGAETAEAAAGRTGGARGLGGEVGEPDGAARRLRQRGDDPPGLVAAGRREPRPACRRRASMSSAPPRTPGCSTGCGSSGFDSSEQTRVMCESLRARGIDCIPVTLQ